MPGPEGWVAIGLTSVAIPFGGWAAKRYLDRRRERTTRQPEIVFDPIKLYGEDVRPRPAYKHAVAFRVTNVGEGPAIRPCFIFADPSDRTIFAEHVTRAVLLPGEVWVEFAGIRGAEQDDDPTVEEVADFHRKGWAIVECWDRLGRYYIFTPRGGGLSKIKPWKGPVDRVEQSIRYPSRGEPRDSAGTGT
jgi:hypothetical protein